MSKTFYSRSRKALDKATSNYKSKPSSKNWKRFKKHYRGMPDET